MPGELQRALSVAQRIPDRWEPVRNLEVFHGIRNADSIYLGCFLYSFMGPSKVRCWSWGLLCEAKSSDSYIVFIYVICVYRYRSLRKIWGNSSYGISVHSHRDVASHSNGYLLHATQGNRRRKMRMYMRPSRALSLKRTTVRLQGERALFQTSTLFGSNFQVIEFVPVCPDLPS